MMRVVFAYIFPYMSIFNAAALKMCASRRLIHSGATHFSKPNIDSGKINPAFFLSKF